MTRKMNQIC